MLIAGTWIDFTFKRKKFYCYCAESRGSFRYNFKLSGSIYEILDKNCPRVLTYKLYTYLYNHENHYNSIS